MALGRRGKEQQEELWIATQDMPETPRHVFYEALNRLLAEAEFDRWIEKQCEPCYAAVGRPSIPPGVFFRMLLIGYFEGISSQRGIAWRCADSLSLKTFLGYRVNEPTPDHSSLTHIRQRLPQEVFDAVFTRVLKLVEEHGLLDGRTVGVDATTLEANAAMKSIVRKDTREDWEEYLRRLAAEEGVEIESKADLIRYDKQRNQRGDKHVSNQEWASPSDPDARIAKMKDGRTHLAYKAEHVVDLKTEVILAAEVYHADCADTATLVESLEKAQAHLDEAEVHRSIEKVAADKGYHKAQTLVECEEEVGLGGVKTYIPEPDSVYERRWTDKPEEQKRAVYHNRRRTAREYGKRLQRRRSEVVERSFAHLCETGGARRSWLRGLEKVRQRYLLAAVAHNLGLILRQLIGAGKPREYGALAAAFYFLQLAWPRLHWPPPGPCFACRTPPPLFRVVPCAA